MKVVLLVTAFLLISVLCVASEDAPKMNEWHIDALAGMGPDFPTIYWIDKNTTHLMSANIRGGTQIRQINTVSKDFPASQLAIINHTTLYWVEKETGELKISRVRGNEIISTKPVETPEKPSIKTLTASGPNFPSLYWLGESMQVKNASVRGDEMLPSKSIPVAILPISFAVTNSFPTMYWIERGSQQLKMAKIRGSELLEPKTIAEDFFATHIAVVGQRLYWVDGNTFKLKTATVRGDKLHSIKEVTVLKD